MADDYRKMDTQYNRFETKHANGILFLLFLWLIGLNPLFVALFGFPMISFYTTYLPQIGHNWIQTPAIIASIGNSVFVVASIILGIGIYNLKRFAWTLIKWYLLAVQLFFWIISIPAFIILPLLNSTAILDNPEEKIKALFFTFLINLITSTIIFVFWFLYRIKSKKAPRQFMEMEK